MFKDLFIVYINKFQLIYYKKQKLLLFNFLLNKNLINLLIYFIKNY